MNFRSYFRILSGSWRRTLNIVFITMVAVSFSNGSLAADSKCPAEFAKVPRDNFQKIKVRQTAGYEFTVNGVLISGGEQYPLAMVRQALALTDSLMADLPASAHVLSVGEGTSDLMPFLRTKFRNTKAIDLWYDVKDLPEELANYVERNKPNLVTGSATNIPFPDKSQKLVVSSFVINNFKEEANQKKALSEMVRVLEPGGQARVTVFGKITTEFFDELKQQYGQEISITVEDFSVQAYRYEGYDRVPATRVGQRVIIDRHLGDW